MSPLAISVAQSILLHLIDSGQRIVCAESCTAGLIAATLASIPGASRHLCGSAVVYRNDTKTRWLGVAQEILDDKTRGDVCAETAERMAHGVLQLTPEADFALSITGHLGPGAPPDLDGVAFVGWAQRVAEDVVILSQKIQLVSSAPEIKMPLERQIERRGVRQREAVEQALQYARTQLSLIASPSNG